MVAGLVAGRPHDRTRRRALVFDIQTARSLGFNPLRKHPKVEPERWCYHCDRLGMLVMQDMVSGGASPCGAWQTSYKPTFFCASWSRFGDRLPGAQRAMGAGDADCRREWTRECAATVRALANHSSIVSRCLFNEGRGQSDVWQERRGRDVPDIEWRPVVSTIEPGEPVPQRIVNLLVGPESDGLRLDAFLAGGPDMPSRSACAKLVEAGAVTINETPATSKSEKVLLGDRVRATVEDPDPAADPALAPNPYIPLDIRYEDEHLIVLSKQAGLVCHPSPGHVDDTLANVLVAHCGPEHLGRLQGDDRPGIVHRLDMDTSGLMLAAKDDETQRALQDLIRLRTLDRRYVTLVWGYVAADSGTIDTGIARSTRDRIRMAVSDDPGAREAITTFRVLERFEAARRDEGYTLLECHLYTGRTHQIRVHMRHINHQCVGDPLYGRGDLTQNLGLTRQFLHSWHVRFDHPATGETIELADALPDDLAHALESLKNRSMGRTAAGEDIVPRLLASRPS